MSQDALATRASIALALTAVTMGLVAALADADPILVAPRALDLLFAERVDVTDAFDVTATALEISHVPLPARGTPEAPVEMTEVLTPARTDVAAGHWTYTAHVIERESESAASGLWDVTLLANGERFGPVRVSQNLSDPHLPEGARVTWDLGAERPATRQLVVIAVPVPPDVGYRLRSEVDATLAPRWKGVGGAIEGQTNPTLLGDVDVEMPIVASNGDGTPHRLLVRDAGGAVVAGPTATLSNPGDEVVLRWTPSAPGTYSYECDFHSTSMTGSIDIETTEASDWQPNSRS